MSDLSNGPLGGRENQDSGLGYMIVGSVLALGMAYFLPLAAKQIQAEEAKKKADAEAQKDRREHGFIRKAKPGSDANVMRAQQPFTIEPEQQAARL